MPQETTPLNTALTSGEVPSIKLRSTAPESAVLTKQEIEALIKTGAPNQGIVKEIRGGSGINVDNNNVEYPIVSAEVTRADLDAKAPIAINCRVTLLGTLGYFTSDGSDPHP